MNDGRSDGRRRNTTPWLSGSAWQSGGVVTNQFISAAIFVVIARALGVSDLGLYSLLITVAALVSTVGTFRLELHLLAEFHGDSDGLSSDAKSMATAVTSAYLLLVPAAAVGMAFGATMSAVGWGISALLAAEVLISPLLFARSYLQVQLRFRDLVVCAFWGRVSFAVLSLVMAALPATDIHLFLVARVVGLAVESGLLWRRAKLAGRLLDTFRQDGVPRNDVARMLVAASPLALAGLGGMLNNRADQVMLGPIAGLASLGVYSAAVRLAEIARSLTAVVQNIGTPSYMALGRTSPGREAGHLRVYSFVLFGLAWPMAAGMVLFGQDVASTFFGDDFVGVGALLVPLAVGELALACASWGATVALGTHQRRLLASSTGIGVGANLILNMVAIPVWGAVGAAWATALSYSATAGVRITRLAGNESISVRDLAGPQVKPLSAAGVAAGVGVMAGRIGLPLVLRMVLFAMAYLAAVYALCRDGPEAEMISP